MKKYYPAGVENAEGTQTGIETYANIINEVLLRRRVISTALVWGGWAGPDWMGPRTYAFAVNLGRFPGRRIEALHQKEVLDDISATLGGIKVGYTNAQGFAYVVKAEPVPALDPVDLLEVLVENPCARVIGPKGSGKTSLLQHLISQARGKRIVVLDPKPPGENNWLHAVPRGLGANWTDMEAALSDMETLLHYRFENGPNVPVLIIADDYWGAARHVRDYPARMMEILTMGRTSRIDLIVGTHTDRVKGMGFDGQGDLLNNFDMDIRLSVIRDRHQSTIDFGEGPVPARHPGPFFSEEDRVLVGIALRYNDGFCSVGKMEKFIKSNRIMRHRYWERNGPFTYHRLQARFKEWEGRGWLQASSQGGDGRKVGRQVSEELRELAEI